MEDTPIEERPGGGAGSLAVAAPTAPGTASSRLTGRYEHRIDGKGRLVLPANHRGHFRAGGYLQVWEGKCLALLTDHGFENMVAHVRRQVLEQGSASGTSVGATMRVAYAATEHVTPDVQGRFIIPPRFRDRAPLSSPVTVIGALDRCEIWLPEALAGEDPSAPNVLEIIQAGYESYPR